jgi:hypothetical protein
MGGMCKENIFFVNFFKTPTEITLKLRRGRTHSGGTMFGSRPQTGYDGWDLLWFALATATE